MPHHSGSKERLGVLSILALTHPRCALYVPIIMFMGVGGHILMASVRVPRVLSSYFVTPRTLLGKEQNKA
jgi:hypothetical protein